VGDTTSTIAVVLEKAWLGKRSNYSWAALYVKWAGPNQGLLLPVARPFNQRITLREDKLVKLVEPCSTYLIPIKHQQGDACGPLISTCLKIGCLCLEYLLSLCKSSRHRVGGISWRCMEATVPILP